MILCRTRYSLYALWWNYRHKGFIPWDDDVDIAMKRVDYENFCRSYVSKKYQLFFEGNSDCMLTFARVCEMHDTIQTYPKSPWIDVSTGVWIDVFPLDTAPDDRMEVEKHIISLKKQMKKIYRSRMAKAKYSWQMPFVWNVKLLFKRILLKTFWDDPHKIVVNYIRECRKYEGI